MKLYFLLKLNPILLDLIRRSDQHQFLSRYMTMLDESYITLLDKYPPESLSLQLSVMKHENTFPFQATEEDFQLSPTFVVHDTLRIIPRHFPVSRTTPVQAFKEHRAALRKFFLDPVRSKHHNFQRSTGKMYAKSLLACFNYLNTQHFRYDYCPHCSVGWRQLIPFNTEETERNLNAVFHNRGNTSAGHQTTNKDWDEYFTNNAEDAVSTEKDIQAWSANWHQLVVSKENAKSQNCPSYHSCKE